MPVSMGPSKINHGIFSSRTLSSFLKEGVRSVYPDNSAVAK